MTKYANVPELLPPAAPEPEKPLRAFVDKAKNLGAAAVGGAAGLVQSVKSLDNPAPITTIPHD